MLSRGINTLKIYGMENQSKTDVNAIIMLAIGRIKEDTQEEAIVILLFCYYRLVLCAVQDYKRLL